MRQAAIGTLLATFLCAEAHAETPARRGTMAFFYARTMTAAQTAWYSRFEMLVTHDPLPAAQAAALRRAGTKLLIYEWSVAFYGSHARQGWRSELLTRRSPALLNHTGLRGHLGASDADAFYFDPASPEHEQRRPVEIGRRLREIGYDGIFLDTTTAASVHPLALREYERRHPRVAYDQAFARFLSQLRRSVPGIVVASNQGFRSAENILPYVDVDVTESLLASQRGGRWQLRRWNDPKDAWNSILPLMKRLIAPARAKYPAVRFVHLNYLDLPARDARSAASAIATVVALARLFGDDAFVTLPDVAGDGREISDVYFLDHGTPGSLVETRQGAFRRFSRGVIAANAGAAPLVIANRRRDSFRDPVTGTRTRRIEVPAASGSVRAVMLQTEQR